MSKCNDCGNFSETLDRVHCCSDSYCCFKYVCADEQCKISCYFCGLNVKYEDAEKCMNYYENSGDEYTADKKILCYNCIPSFISEINKEYPDVDTVKFINKFYKQPRDFGDSLIFGNSKLSYSPYGILDWYGMSMRLYVDRFM